MDKGTFCCRVKPFCVHSAQRHPVEGPLASGRSRARVRTEHALHRITCALTTHVMRLLLHTDPRRDGFETKAIVVCGRQVRDVPGRFLVCFTRISCAVLGDDTLCQ